MLDGLDEVRSASIRLRNYRLNPRKARVDVVGDAAVLALPVYFGRRRWVVKLSDIAVVDLTRRTSWRTRRMTCSATTSRSRTSSRLVAAHEPGCSD